jgi:AcrR family transcriptional regulator
MPAAPFASQVIDALFSRAAVWRERLFATLRNREDADDAFSEMSIRALRVTGHEQSPAEVEKFLQALFEGVALSYATQPVPTGLPLTSRVADQVVAQKTRRAKRVSERWDEVVRAFKRLGNPRRRAQALEVLRGLFEVVKSDDMLYHAATQAIAIRTGKSRPVVQKILAGLRNEITEISLQEARRARQ